jgi:hypothetical protein
MTMRASRARELGKELVGEAMRGSFGKDEFWN